MSRHRGAMFADRTRTRSSKVLLGILWRYLSPFKQIIFTVALLTLVYTAAVTYQPILVQNAIDQLLGGSSFDSLILLLVLYASLSLFSWLSNSLITWLMARVQNDLIHVLRSDTFEKMVEADMAYHAQVQSGNVTSRVINDTQEITAGLSVFTTSLTNLLVAFATLGVLFSISIWFGLIALLALPTAGIITKVISSKGRERMLKVRSSMGRVSGKLAENLAGVAIAKSFNQEERTSAEIRKLNDETFEYFKQLGAMFTMIFPSITLVSMVMISMILFVGGYMNEIGLMTSGAIYLGTVMVRRFLSPILALSNNITNLQASLAALDRVVDVLQTKPAVTNAPNAEQLIVTDGEIELKGVWFKYKINETARKSRRRDDAVLAHSNGNVNESRGRGEEWVLKNVSFKIPGKKKTALIGHTGAGKTTVTKLVLRFYDPDKGSIVIDGQDIRGVTLESLYDSISLVTQEPYLFAGTILQNIKYGKPDASDEEVFELCRRIGADEFIEALPDGYDTEISESGKSLSAGQRQMITIARTMLQNPKILILDEATSRLDAYTESLVQEAQNMLFEGRTTLVIAHRLSTIRDVDQIVVMDHGEVVELGTHEELMKLKGKYYELYNTYYAHQGLEIMSQ
ncbi:MAG: ABC transporter ATP-binding protein [Methanobacteriota archaeon]|nr:MAG: ABC transporter ATP-binding protein [Euryarchaeota archaeon]